MTQSAGPSTADWGGWRRTAAVTALNYVSYSTWTLLNKWQFKEHGTRFSVLLTAWQMLFVGVLCGLLAASGQARWKPLHRRVLLRRIVPLGLVRSADIGFGNAALVLVSVALQQIIKSTIPVYVCMLTVLLLRRPVSGRVWLSLGPVVGGTLLATYGELSYAATGVVFAVLSCVARAGKKIVNDMLLHTNSEDDRLGPLQIVGCESPLSGVLLLCVGALLEWETCAAWYAREHRVSVPRVLLYNSAMGCLMLMNQWSYISIIECTSAVTCGILMNLKMVTLITVSVVMFGTHLGLLNWCGIAVATGGCVLYAHVKQQESLEAAAAERGKLDALPV